MTLSRISGDNEAMTKTARMKLMPKSMRMKMIMEIVVIVYDNEDRRGDNGNDMIFDRYDHNDNNEE